MPKVVVDARMINSSGIGVYIKNILHEIFSKKLLPYEFYLMGTECELKEEFDVYSSIKYIYVDSPIYSIKEQIDFFKKIPSDTTLFWSPHYNIPLFYKGKLLVTVHDVFHLRKDINNNSLVKQIYAKALFNFVSKKADKIITVSDFTKNEYLSYVNEGDRDKVNVIYNGVDTTWYLNKQEVETKYMVYVGNVKPHKNLLRLIKAFKSIKDEIPHNLIIIGKRDGFITPDNTVLEEAGEIPDRIHFTGYLEDNKLREVVASADFLVYPSLYEGFGLPPLEAMACGCPVLASKAASIPEVCKDYVEYVDPYDINDIANGILNLANNDEKKKEMSSRGIAYAKSYTWEQCAIEVARCMQEVIEK
ncbi:glycosyltransferase family 4 protein [Bacillus mobilis]|uniref:glycosyltransferase family 4 protein n=1 Tax=Bacillus mobilis TaxID=2026190 RepID=UPI0022DEC0B5|nr:glycosyltransferase family 1 protein [Bacillus mobilis]